MNPDTMNVNFFLNHILQETEFIIDITSSMTVEEFASNKEHKHSLVRALEIIGETGRFSVLS